MSISDGRGSRDRREVSILGQVEGVSDSATSTRPKHRRALRPGLCWRSEGTGMTWSRSRIITHCYDSIIICTSICINVARTTILRYFHLSHKFILKYQCHERCLVTLRIPYHMGTHSTSFHRQIIGDVLEMYGTSNSSVAIWSIAPC